MSDLINRQAAIDAYGDWYVEEGTAEGFIGTVKQLLEGLPSAQPEPVTDCHGLTGDLISRQKAINAFHYYFRDGFEEDKWWNSTHVLAAIEGIPSVQQEHKWETCFDCPLSHGCPKIKGCANEQAIECASQIPNDCPLSTQTEPKTGRWIYGEDDVAMCDGYHCSECGFFVPWDYKRKFIDFIKDYNFCPSCGSPMLKEGEG